MGSRRASTRLTRRALLGSACAHAAYLALTPARGLAADGARVTDVPFLHVDDELTAEACAVMALRAQDISVDIDDVFEASGVSPAHGRGVTAHELDGAMLALGVDTGTAWRPVTRATETDVVARAWQELRAELQRARPVVLLLGRGAGERPGAPAFIVATAVRGDTLVFHDPARADGAARVMPRARLRERWPTRGEDRERGIVLLTMRPSALQIPEPEPGRRARAYLESVRALHETIRRHKLPGSFRVAVERPFVVATDGPPAFQPRYVEGTIRWAVEHLRRDFFPLEPTEIVVVWLFKDRASYVGNTVRLYQEKPFTPYGYYDPARDVLVMNISTGGGTLVHELVHPHMAANFPACPAWLDEGLASLYEQPAERDGRMVGLTNWRLPGLQQALRRKRVPTLKALTETGKRRFYSRDNGTNYAHARYLCYYLQERGLLRPFYHAFQQGCADDPTGYVTLLRTLGVDEDGMPEFRTEWERFVLALRYPQR